MNPVFIALLIFAGSAGYLINGVTGIAGGILVASGLSLLLELLDHLIKP